MDKTETKKYYYPNLDKYLHYCTFGQRMRQIRKSRGLSQDEFAAMLGTSKQILSRYELEPEHTIFIDDREENVVAARQRGIVAFHFNRNYYQQSCDLLREMLL